MQVSVRSAQDLRYRPCPILQASMFDPGRRTLNPKALKPQSPKPQPQTFNPSTLNPETPNYALNPKPLITKTHDPRLRVQGFLIF